MTAPAEPTLPRETLREAPHERPANRSALLLAASAGLCWAGALGMLLLDVVGPEQAVDAPPRLMFYALALGAGLLTFVPLQRHLRVPQLALEGVAGSFLLLYLLAFVPPPNGWLLSPPDMPAWVILAAAVFWSLSALAIWPVSAIGRRIFQQRARQYDTRRARRQAHEIGALAALSVGLAGLRVLTPVGVGLLALILIVAELLFLAFVETET
ncbi:MAG: hypothetical protein DIU80_009320 [Chloroflexota bacterium]|mgnify:FL=1